MEDQRKTFRNDDVTPVEVTPLQPVIISYFDRWLRIILLCLNIALLLVMFWIMALVNRNYSFGGGNRDLSCATARVILSEHPDPELRYQIEKHC